MTAKNLVFTTIIFLCQMVSAQQQPITLNEVVVSDSNLRDFSKTQSVTTISDSVVAKNNPSLTDLLRFSSGIYFKENGYGMVSSPSFRGTTAQHTAVIWNGININSQFNGQTDFNTITTKSFNKIDVKSGGGSVIYGTSAIGGSIHLNNDLRFEDNQSHNFRYSGGSYNTHQSLYNIIASSHKWSVNASVERNASTNDYTLPNGLKNANGQFENFTISANAGIKLNNKHLLKIYSQFSQNDRNFSLLFPSDTKTKYVNEDVRNLLEWHFGNDVLSSTLRFALLNEQYIYVENLTTNKQSKSVAETVIGKYEIGYKFGTSQVKSIVEFNSSDFEGTDIKTGSRQIGSAALLFSQKVYSRWYYEAGLRKEISNAFTSPLLFSAGTTFALNDKLSFNLNGSRNFRIPTFNDLHWNGVGSADLSPETSHQIDLGATFNLRNHQLKIGVYYIDIVDMIQWLPGVASAWQPSNVKEVTSKGVEFSGKSHWKVGLNTIELVANYTFTSSQNNARKQLIYVPKHVGNLSLAFNRKQFSSFFQVLYNDDVFTRTDNNPRYIVEGFTVANLGSSYQFKNFELGVRINNLFDTDYFAVDRRPFAGRNYTMYLNLNL